MQRASRPGPQVLRPAFAHPPPPLASRRGAQRVGDIRRSCQKPQFWVQHRFEECHAKWNDNCTAKRRKMGLILCQPPQCRSRPPNRVKRVADSLAARFADSGGGLVPTLALLSAVARPV